MYGLNRFMYRLCMEEFVMNSIPIPNKEEFIRGIEEFEKHGKRDAIYKVASFLIHHFWIIRQK